MAIPRSYRLNNPDRPLPILLLELQLAHREREGADLRWLICGGGGPLVHASSGESLRAGLGFEAGVGKDREEKGGGAGQRGLER